MIYFEQIINRIKHDLLIETHFSFHFYLLNETFFNIGTSSLEKEFNRSFV